MSDRMLPTAEQQPSVPAKKRRRGRPSTKNAQSVYTAVSAGSGRPAKPPAEKLKRYVRFTCNQGLKDVIEALAQERGMNESDYMRLALYRFLEAEGKMTDELRRNPTWETLVNQGVAQFPTRRIGKDEE